MRGIISKEAKRAGALICSFAFPEDKPGGTYKAKPGGWFDPGTTVECVSDFRPIVDSGIFRGMRGGKIDEEVCGFDEFSPAQSE